MTDKFDITKHKWSDVGLSSVTEHNEVQLMVPCNKKWFNINKDDSIAIAKHHYETLSDAEKLLFIAEITNIPVTVNPKSLGAIPDDDKSGLKPEDKGDFNPLRAKRDGDHRSMTSEMKLLRAFIEAFKRKPGSN